MTTRTTASYTDFSALASLRGAARKDADKATEKVARQFESVFMEMMLKSMRQASLGEGAMDSDQSELYRDMFDKQVALSLSEQKGIGLADVMVRQLRQQAGGKAVSGGEGEKVYLVPERGQSRFRLAEGAAAPGRIGAGHTSATAGPAMQRGLAAGAKDPAPTAERFESPEAFAKAMWPHAERAARRLGTDPRALIAQAALETGWGGSVIRGADGSSSHNLFNIKADHRWEGERVEKRTLEFRDGVAVREQAAFRAYGSWAESFDDYVDFLASNPRYKEALGKASDPKAFVDALQKAGYATDPAYATKIRRIMSGETLVTAAAELKSAGGGTLTVA